MILYPTKKYLPRPAARKVRHNNAKKEEGRIYTPSSHAANFEFTMENQESGPDDAAAAGPD